MLKCSHNGSNSRQVRKHGAHGIKPGNDSDTRDKRCDVKFTIDYKRPAGRRVVYLTSIAKHVWIEPSNLVYSWALTMNPVIPLSAHYAKRRMAIYNYM